MNGMGAVLTTAQSGDLGTLGYVARTSGLDVDARRDHPTGIRTDDGTHLGDLLTVPTHTGGDVLARFQQRAAEIDVSLAVLDTLVRTVTPGTITGWPTADATPPPAAKLAWQRPAWASWRAGAAPSRTVSRSAPTSA